MLILSLLAALMVGLGVDAIADYYINKDHADLLPSMWEGGADELSL